jgi:uncharacterized membrane protein YukC
MQMIEQTAEFLQKNSGVLILVVCMLLLVAMLRHLKQGRKLEKNLDVINENMAFHFEQMMDSKAQFEAEKAKERKLEREALAKAEKQKMEKEQEAVFDAVLQEIFP